MGTGKGKWSMVCDKMGILVLIKDADTTISNIPGPVVFNSGDPVGSYCCDDLPREQLGDTGSALVDGATLIDGVGKATIGPKFLRASISEPAHQAHAVPALKQLMEHHVGAELRPIATRELKSRSSQPAVA